MTFPCSRSGRAQLALTLALSLLAVACQETKDADGEPGGCGPATRAGESLLVACAEAIELEIGSDGLPLQVPEGSTCELSASYRLELDTRTLSWRECEPEGDLGTPWVEHEGTRDLSSSDYEHLLDTLAMIEVQAPSDSCGFDKSTVTVRVATDNGSHDYVDAFYACRGDQNTYVAPVDPAAELFATLAFEADDASVEDDELSASEDAWSSLVEENDDTYWYRTSVCGQRIREVTWVQVTDGAVSLVAREREDDATCTHDEPYVYATFDGRTLDALYDECEQIRQRPAVDASSFSVDENGVVRTCWSTTPDCADACDEGFYITDRGFGTGDFGDATPD